MIRRRPGDASLGIVLKFEGLPAGGFFVQVPPTGASIPQNLGGQKCWRLGSGTRVGRMSEPLPGRLELQVRGTSPATLRSICGPRWHSTIRRCAQDLIWLGPEGPARSRDRQSGGPADPKSSGPLTGERAESLPEPRSPQTGQGPSCCPAFFPQAGQRPSRLAGTSKTLLELAIAAGEFLAPRLVSESKSRHARGQEGGDGHGEDTPWSPGPTATPETEGRPAPKTPLPLEFVSMTLSCSCTLRRRVRGSSMA